MSDNVSEETQGDIVRVEHPDFPMFKGAEMC